MQIKDLGQVWTPEWLTQKVLDKANFTGNEILNKKILEPSFGAGVFLKEIINRIITVAKNLKHTNTEISSLINENVYGIEYDTPVYEATKKEIINEVLKEHNIQILLPNLYNQDALDYNNENFFDYIVGNPPYVRIHNLPQDMRDKVKKHSLSNGTTDLYIIFYELGLKWLNPTGTLSYIAPNSWLKNSSQKTMREQLTKHSNIKEIVDYGTLTPFPKIATYTCITVLTKQQNKTLTFTQMKNFENEEYTVKIPYSYLTKNKGKPFSFVSKEDYKFLKNLRTNTTIEDIAKVQNGLATLGDKYFLTKPEQNIEKQYVLPVVKASTYKGNTITQRMIFPYTKKDNRYTPISLKNTENTSLHQHFNNYKTELSNRSLDKNTPWYGYGRSQAIQETDKRKLIISPIIPPTQKQLKTFIVPENTLVYSGLFITEIENGYSLETIKEILETETFIRYARLHGKPMNGNYKNINSKILKKYFISTVR